MDHWDQKCMRSVIEIMSKLRDFGGHPQEKLPSHLEIWKRPPRLALEEGRRIKMLLRDRGSAR